MIIAIFILGFLLAVSAAIIFCLFTMLKNTLNVIDGLTDIANNKTPKRLKTAYNNKYYPATLIAQVLFEQDTEGKVVDFSRYDSHKIVGFTILVKDKMEDYYGAELIEEIGEEAAAELGKPVIIRNVLVYEVSEGDWLWKSAE